MVDHEFIVLTVDDARLVRSNVRSILTDIKIQNVLEATNGKEAIRILNNTHVDLIISDWNMPEVNGQELLEWVRANKITQKTPFIMLTAEADKDKVVDAVKAGANNYIIKPFTPETLIRKIKAFLPPDIQVEQNFGRVIQETDS